MNSLQILRLISLIFHPTLVFGLEVRQSKYNILNGLKISQNYHTFYGVVTITKCAILCLNDDFCTSANYNGAGKQCELTQHNPEDGSVEIVEDINWKIISIKNQLWNLIFRGTAGIGIPTYSAYIGTANIPTSSDACKLTQTTNCTTHYRNSEVIDSWNSHYIQQVKFVLYKAGVAVVNVTFSNTDLDNNTSWFNADNINSSSYVDLPSTTIVFFGLYGVDYLQRRFYISESWTGCQNDVGWMCVFDVDPTESLSSENCAFAKGRTYPYFAYLPNNAKGTFHTDLQGADVMAIYTKN